MNAFVDIADYRSDSVVFISEARKCHLVAVSADAIEGVVRFQLHVLSGSANGVLRTKCLARFVLKLARATKRAVPDIQRTAELACWAVLAAALTCAFRITVEPAWGAWCFCVAV